MTEQIESNLMISDALGEAVRAAADILAGRAIQPLEASALIREIHSTIVDLARSELPKSEASAPTPTPFVHPKKSVTDEYIICLHDGKKFKSLTRHLKSHFNQTPDEYRRLFGLPADYPMVAPAYAKRRSELALSFGLGKGRGRKKVNGAAPVELATAPVYPEHGTA